MTARPRAEVHILDSTGPAPVVDDPALQGALNAMGAALGKYDDHMRSALASITADDVAPVLKSVPLSQRSAALRPIDLRIVPRNIGQGVAQDVARRLRTGRSSQTRPSLQHMCPRVLNDIHAYIANPDEAPDPTARWGERVLRAALWSSCRATVASARVWAWAAAQPWFATLPGGDEHADGVARAAEYVIDLTPDFVQEPRDTPAVSDDEPTRDMKANGVVDDKDEGTGNPAPDAPTTVQTRLWVSSEPPLDEDLRTLEPDSDEDGNRHEDEHDADSSTQDLDDAHGSAARALATATISAERIWSDVKSQRAPAADDIDALYTLRRAFNSFVGALAHAGAAAGPDEALPALTSALATLRQSAADQSLLARLNVLACLAPLAGNGALSAALSQLQAEVAALIAARPWDRAARVQAECLALLTDLVAMPDEQANAQTRLQLITRLATDRPDLSFLATQTMLLTTALDLSRPTDESELGEPVGLETLAEQPMDPTQRGVALAEDEDSLEPEVQTEMVAPSDRVGLPDAARVHGADQPALETAEADPVAEVPVGTPRDPATDLSAQRGLIVDTLAELIAERRFALAAQLAQAADLLPSVSRTLRIAALDQAVRTEHGPCAAALRAELTELDSSEVATERYLTLLAVPALVHSALVTGESACGALLGDLAPRVDPSLEAVADEVGRRALRGALAGAPVLTTLAAVTGGERARASASEVAAHVRDRPRQLRFKRASDIAHLWLSPDGFLGRPLTQAANGIDTAVDEVASSIRRLSDPSAVSAEIDRQDRKLKGPSGGPVDGRGRQDLLSLVQEAVTALANWAEVVLADTRSGAGASEPWFAADLGAMRQAVIDQRDAVQAYLEGQTAGTSPLVAAAAKAAAASMRDTFNLLEGRATPRTAVEPAPATVLTAELLKVPGAQVDPALRVVNAPDADVMALVAAAPMTWEQALEAQIVAENFTAARFLLEAASHGDLPGSATTMDLGAQEDRVTSAERTVRTALEQIHDDLVTQVRRARVSNQITDGQESELTSLLLDANPAGQNLAAVRRTLLAVEVQLPKFTAFATAQLLARVDKMTTPRGVDADAEAHIRRLIDQGQLSTAEEFITFLENGEDLPEVIDRTLDLTAFYPAVPNRLTAGLSPGLIELVAAGGIDDQCPALDFGELRGTAADDAAAALRGWLDLSQAPPDERHRRSLPNVLLPALRLAGIDARKVVLVDDLPRSRDFRFYDLSEVTITGNAAVPEFGTKLGGRLRILLLWGQPSAEMLMTRTEHTGLDSSLLVVHLGTLSTQRRRDLAVASVGRPPVIVLDDAALAYAAAHGSGLVDTTMRILLPFSSVNPYQRQKRGLVHEEMFYGRDGERRDLLAPEGSQLVYGGRGLGKSALLRNTQARFESQAFGGETRVAIYRNLDTTPIHAGSPNGADAIWNALSDSLSTRSIIAPIREPGANLHEAVTAAIHKWLAVDGRRRMLILFDESDPFFEADAPRFLETKRLKDLGQVTGGKVKVVFAGLHSVQRYAKVAPNGPFSHMAQHPIVIGPLTPQPAADLLTRPLTALGFTFANTDLVNRILGYCSYQPFLLQMFAQRLVQLMHTRRVAEGPKTAHPPFVIRQQDVESVETHPVLQVDIRNAFRDTLLLDPRYDLIANLLARRAHENGLDARMSDADLRVECLEWWREGFAAMDVESFRAYLVEMVGLGVLAPNNDGRGWRLRSPNVLRMVGTTADVDALLLGASTSAVGEDFIAVETRLPLSDGRHRSPLSAAQMSDVLGDFTNQVRVVLGSRATGIDLVGVAVRETAANGDRFEVPAITRRRQFAEELTRGTPGRRRVVLDDLVSLDLDEGACREALSESRSRLPSLGGVTRSAVLVLGPAQLGLWRTLLEPAGQLATDPGVGAVILRRYDAKTLRVWQVTVTGQRFVEDEQRTRLLELTGGWPILVDQVTHWVEEGASETAALRRLESELDTLAGAEALVLATGLASDPVLASAYTALVTLVGQERMSLADMEAGAGSASAEETGTTIACLAALQVFTVEPDGWYSMEPVLARAWQRRG